MAVVTFMLFERFWQIKIQNSTINGTKSICKSQVITLSLSNYYKKSHNTPFCAKLVPKGGQSQ